MNRSHVLHLLGGGERGFPFDPCGSDAASQRGYEILPRTAGDGLRGLGDAVDLDSPECAPGLLDVPEAAIANPLARAHLLLRIISCVTPSRVQELEQDVIVPPIPERMPDAAKEAARPSHFARQIARERRGEALLQTSTANSQIVDDARIIADRRFVKEKADPVKVAVDETRESARGATVACAGGVSILHPSKFVAKIASPAKEESK